MIQACRECCIAGLLRADPINHSTLHHFRCVSAVHLPYNEHPKGFSTPALFKVYHLLWTFSESQLVFISVILLFFHPSVSSLYCLSFLLISFFFLLQRWQAGSVLCLACAHCSQCFHCLRMQSLIYICKLFFFVCFFFFNSTDKCNPVFLIRRQWTVLLWFYVATIMRMPVNCGNQALKIDWLFYLLFFCPFYFCLFKKRSGVCGCFSARDCGGHIILWEGETVVGLFLTDSSIIYWKT